MRAPGNLGHTCACDRIAAGHRHTVVGRTPLGARDSPHRPRRVGACAGIYRDHLERVPAVVVRSKTGLSQ